MGIKQSAIIKQGGEKQKFSPWACRADSGAALLSTRDMAYAQSTTKPHHDLSIPFASQGTPL